MKKIIVLSIILAFAMANASAQEKQIGEKMQKFQGICLNALNSFNKKDLKGMENAMDGFDNMSRGEIIPQKCKVMTPEAEASIEGHFLFTPEFLDSMIIVLDTIETEHPKPDHTRGGKPVTDVDFTHHAVKAGATAQYQLKWGSRNGFKQLLLISENPGNLEVTIEDTPEKMVKTLKDSAEKPALSLAWISPSKGNWIKVTVKNNSKKDIAFIIAHD